jgi:hypothetical protein
VAQTKALALSSIVNTMATKTPMRLDSTRGLAGVDSVGSAERSDVVLFMAPNLHQIRYAKEKCAEGFLFFLIRIARGE